MGKPSKKVRQTPSDQRQMTIQMALDHAARNHAFPDETGLVSPMRPMRGGLNWFGEGYVHACAYGCLCTCPPKAHDVMAAAVGEAVLAATAMVAAVAAAQ
ncbi:hypothetical protein HaLaN_11891, partial [Haematococcus lacustris]